MRLTRRAGDRLQRALEGEQATDPETTNLLETARAMAAVPAGAMAPREQFVRDLHERLMAEAATMPAGISARSAPAPVTGGRSAPVVVVVGRGLPRALAGAAASVLVIGTVVGVASRSAVPGSALYPVKGWLDSVAVQLAGSDLDRGLTRLSQAEEHIAETRDLVEQGEHDGGPYNEALEAAVSSVRDGQRDLNAAFDATGNPQALIAIRDFSARALPQVEALRPDVPAAALPALSELEGLLHDSEATALRRLALCAPSCVTLQQTAVSPSDLPTLPVTAGGAAGTGGVPAPSTTVTANPDGAAPAPGVTAGSGGLTLGGTDGGATLSTNGGTVNGPTVSLSATSLPGVSATLPSVGISTDGVVATVPDTTLGGVTLPGLTATVPLP